MSDVRLDPFRTWLRTRGRFLQSRGEFVEELSEQVLAVGVPAYRLTTGIPLLHPSIKAESTMWVEGKGAETRQYGYGSELDEMYRRSPLYQVYEFGHLVHAPVTPDFVPGEYGVLEDLRAEGGVDYLAVPIRFSDGSHKSVTLATRMPGGFTADAISLMKEVAEELAPILELQMTQRLARTLLDVYVGHQTGERVLKGEIQRGEGEVLSAAVWFSDLRGFTNLSNNLEGGALLDVLNTYFDIMAESVEDNGGEVLKFIGDAVLAIFPFHHVPDKCDASDRALFAACKAFQDLKSLSNDRMTSGSAPIETGIGLHLGDVYYGNVGSHDRLDFTVIGPTVNLASRIQGLCGDLKRPILVSQELMEKSKTFAFEPQGSFDLKGFDRPQSVFATI